MPDIFKRLEFVESEDTVEIPDMNFGRSPSEAEPLEENAQEQSDDADGGQERWVSAPALTKEELEAQYAGELSELRQNAAVQGRSEASQQMQGKIETCLAEVETTLAEMQALQRQYLEQYAKELQSLAIDIAEKIMLQRIEEDDTALKALVLQTVSSIKRYKWLSIEVSEQLTGLVDALKEEIRRPEYGTGVDVSPGPYPIDTCRVSSEAGTTVASISVQIQNLREAFADENMQ